MEIAGLLLAGIIALVWIDSLRSRERALEASRRACERYDVQLLDDTIAATKIRLARDDEGQLRVARTYSFEFSATGHNRLAGRIEMLGASVKAVELEPYGDQGGDAQEPANVPHLRVIK